MEPDKPDHMINKEYSFIGKNTVDIKTFVSKISRKEGVLRFNLKLPGVISK